jgi:hypothetical protein
MNPASFYNSPRAEPGFPGEEKWDLQSLERHLDGVLHGDAFRGSHRSGRFLKYIVQRAVAGDLDGLKERGDRGGRLRAAAGLRYEL